MKEKESVKKPEKQELDCENMEDVAGGSQVEIQNVVKDNKVPSKYDIGENKVVYVPMVSQISEEEIARCCSLPLEQVLALKEELAHKTVTVTN